VEARSPSPPPATRARRSTSPAGRDRINIPYLADHDPQRRRERERQLAEKLAERAEAELKGQVVPKPQADPKLEMEKLAKTRAGGAYIPPQ
jgi:pre-mRNA-splicing factor CWC22